MMQLDRLIAQVVQKTQAIQLIISKLEELRFPSSNPQRLARLISNIAQAIKDEILTRYQAGPSSAEDFENEVKLAVRALEALGSHLRFVERATTQQTPWSLVQPLERISEQLYPDSCFVIRPQWHYNYSIRELTSAYREAFSKLLAENRLSEALKLNHNDSIKRLYVISFPYLDRFSVLMLTLLGHELGHPIEEEYLKQERDEWKEFFKNHQRFHPSLERIYQAVLREHRVPPKPEVLDLFTMEKISKMFGCVLTLRRRVLEELICDLTSVNLFGPAALFATEELILSRELDTLEIEPPEDHYPPWRYRLRVMWEEFPSEWMQKFIQEGQFDERVSQSLNAKLNSILAVINEKTDMRKPEARIAYESVEEALPKVRDFVRKRLKKQGFCLDDLLGRINDRLLKRLESWIPPDSYVNDAGSEIVSDMRSILNVGWLCWICNYASMPTKANTSEKIDEYFQHVDALNRLVLKAIEYVDLRSVLKQKQHQRGNRNASTDTR
jgi:hypothetical protein